MRTSHKGWRYAENILVLFHYLSLSILVTRDAGLPYAQVEALLTPLYLLAMIIFRNLISNSLLQLAV